MSEVSDVFYDVSGPSNVAGFCGDLPGNPDKTLSRFDNTLQGGFFLFFFAALMQLLHQAVMPSAKKLPTVDL